MNALLSKYMPQCLTVMFKVHKVLRRLMQQGKIRAREGRRWEWAADDSELPMATRLHPVEIFVRVVVIRTSALSACLRFSSFSKLNWENCQAPIPSHCM